MRCDGVCLMRLNCEVREVCARDEVLARCFVSDALSWVLMLLGCGVLFLADCSTDNAGGAMYCAASFFCDKGCSDSI